MDNHTAIVHHEEEFTVNDTRITVSLYFYEGRYKMTSWLRGVEELNTIDVTDFIEKEPSENEIINKMHQLIHDNVDYIMDMIGYGN